MSNTKLKFRAWSYKDSKFYTRVLVGDTETDDPCSSVWNDETKEWVHFDKHCGVIQQFTGLYDKNKKPIYEGDILKVKITDEVIPTNNGRKINACVRWDNFHAHWIVEGKIEKGMLDGEQYPFGCNENCYIDHHSPVTVDAKIIGNIFENSELLKQ